MSLPTGIMGVLEQHSHDTSWQLIINDLIEFCINSYPANVENMVSF
jgi:hypothetical protein